MRPLVPTVRALTTGLAVSAAACALLCAGTVTAVAATPTGHDGQGTSGGGWTSGWGGGGDTGGRQHHPAPAPRPATTPTPPPRATPAPTPTATPTPPPRPRHTPPTGSGHDPDGQLPGVFWQPHPAPPAPRPAPAAHPATPQPPHPASPVRLAMVTHHSAPPPHHTPVSPPAAAMIALAATAPLASVGARIPGIPAVIPLPGWGQLRSTLLSGPAGATGVLGGIAVAGSAVIGLGAYLCTRLRRRLASLW